MNKEQLFAALAAEVKEIEVKALNTMVRFKVMSGVERDAFHTAIAAGDKSASHFEASIVASSVVDADNQPVFTVADVDALRTSSAPALAALAKVAMQVNKIGVEAEAEAAKN
jgi:hypothetical protein